MDVTQPSGYIHSWTGAESGQGCRSFHGQTPDVATLSKVMRCRIRKETVHDPGCRIDDQCQDRQRMDLVVMRNLFVRLIAQQSWHTLCSAEFSLLYGTFRILVLDPYSDLGPSLIQVRLFS